MLQIANPAGRLRERPHRAATAGYRSSRSRLAQRHHQSCLGRHHSRRRLPWRSTRRRRSAGAFGCRVPSAATRSPRSRGSSSAVVMLRRIALESLEERVESGAYSIGCQGVKAGLLAEIAASLALAIACSRFCRGDAASLWPMRLLSEPHDGRIVEAVTCSLRDRRVRLETDLP